MHKTIVHLAMKLQPFGCSVASCPPPRNSADGAAGVQRLSASHAFPLLQAALMGALWQPQVPSHIPGRRRGCAMHQTPPPHIAAYICTCKEGSSVSVKPPSTSQGFPLTGGLKAVNATRMPSVRFDRADFQR